MFGRWTQLDSDNGILAFDPEIFQDGGDVDALAAELNLLASGAVDLPQRKMLHPDDIVERRIKGHGINQINPPL